ncbi:hypothetical protein ACHAWC_000090, partial [Mediolabrus comicus]
LTQAQLLAIENEIKLTQPLTSSLLPISTLLRQYSDHSADSNNNDSSDSNNSGGNEAAGTKYTSIRKIRGDGNCYYRAFLYALCECLLLRASEFKRIKDQIVNSLKWVCQYGYDEMTIDMFHEELVDLLNFIEKAVMS